MTEAQGWSLIGLLGAAILASPTMIVLYLRSEISGLGREIGGLRREMELRFEAMDRRFDHLDRDVAAMRIPDGPLDHVHRDLAERADGRGAIVFGRS